MDSKFCKLCGTSINIRDKNIDLSHSSELSKRIEDRIQQLDSILNSSSYSKQKSHLMEELSAFLLHLRPQKTLDNALPHDIQMFLIYKEDNGRTTVHIEGCKYKGKGGKDKCPCPKKLAAKSVDSLIGKLRAIFRDLGRTGEWNNILKCGNPAASFIIKRHLQAVTLEQETIVPKQAVPLMFDKLGKLCRYLNYHISVEQNNTKKFLLSRDRAYFSILCHSGDRGGDLGSLTFNRIFNLPNNKGLFYLAYSRQSCLSR